MELSDDRRRNESSMPLSSSGSPWPTDGAPYVRARDEPAWPDGTEESAHMLDELDVPCDASTREAQPGYT